jgi:hypothetical protein
MGNNIQVILELHNYWLSAIEKRMDRLPAQGFGGSYRNPADGTDARGSAIYFSNIAYPKNDSPTLEFCIKMSTPLPNDHNYSWIPEYLTRESEEGFLTGILEQAKGLATTQLFLSYFLTEHPGQRKGWEFSLKSADMKTVTSVIRKMDGAMHRQFNDFETFSNQTVDNLLIDSFLTYIDTNYRKMIE